MISSYRMHLPPLSSIRAKLLLALLALQLLLFLGYVTLTSLTLNTAMTRNLEVTAAQTAEILNLALTPYSSENRLAAIQEFFDELIRNSDEGMIYLAVEDGQGKRLFTAGQLADGPLPAASTDVATAIRQGIYHHRQPILLGTNAVGSAQFGLATDTQQGLQHSLITTALGLGAGAMALIILLALVLGARVNRRLEYLMANLDAVASGRYDNKLVVQGRDEFAQLATNINRMADAVWLREKTFTSVFNAAPLPMVLLRAACGQTPFVIDTMNQAALDMFELQLSEVIGRNAAEVGHRLDPEGRRRLIETISQSPGSQLEISFPDLQGGTLHGLFSGQVFDVLEHRYLIIALADVSELRRVEDELRQTNVELEARVVKRTAALNAKNQELAQTLEHLHQAQHQLVQAEKLSSLGSVVAAVAHELNTPIGNALTVATTQQARQRELQRQFQQGMTRSTLQQYLESGEQASLMLVRNLQRAAELVTGFKEVAVDRTSSQRRQFDLATVVDEILMTLRPMLKHTPCRLESSVPAGLLCDSYPGPLGQIITNLVENALRHAFAPDTPGLIDVVVTRLDERHLQLTVRDDGCGIPVENLKRIFDPFFTTRLGQGGSGLGLHIAYNLVTGLLGGTLSVTSSIGHGSQFVIEFPCIAPHDEASSVTH